MKKFMLAAAMAAMLFGTWPADARSAGGPDEKTRYEYAASLYMRGAFDSAVTEFTNFIKDYPKGEYTDDAYYFLGKYYMANGKPKDALDQFGIIIALFKDSDKAPAAQFELASYHYDPKNPDRDYEKAISEFLKVPFFYPGSPFEDDARYYAALSQMRSGNLQQAVDDFRALIEKHPDSEYASAAAYNIGLAFVLDGKPGESRAEFQRVRDGYPAGLYSTEALTAIELVARYNDRKELKLAYQYGAKGEEPGKFYKPTGIASSPDGELYITDTGNSRVQVLKRADKGLDLLKPSLASNALDKSLRMDDPAGITVAPDGNVYVTDAGLHRVQIFSPSGDLLTTFGRKGSERGGLSSPAGIGVAETGSIYVSDNSNKRIGIFGPDGVTRGSVGDHGVADDSILKSPTGIAFGVDGDIYAADNSTDRIYRYDSEGGLLMVYGDKPLDGYGLKDPAGIAVDALGYVYVADRSLGAILVFDRELRPVLRFPAAGKDSPLDTPSGVCIGPGGEVYVVDSGLNQVVVLK